MVKLKLKFKDIESTKEFVRITEKQPFDVDISSGRQVVDAKSILGVLSIDLSRDHLLLVNAENEQCKTYLEDIKEYIV